VCKVGPGTRGATWGPDDTIVFGQEPGLARVKAAGGQAQGLFQPDSAADEIYSDPSFLPGGRALLYTVVQSGGHTRVMARRLDGGPATVVAERGAGARIYDLTAADPPLKLTHRGHSHFPNWSADGRRIYLMLASPSGPLVRSLPADGSVLEPEPGAKDDVGGVPWDCSPDGAYLIFGTGSKNYLLPLAGGAPRPWPGTPFTEKPADFSPDGRFLMIEPSGVSSAAVVLVQNWAEELERQLVR